jgi:hypothetical protein
VTAAAAAAAADTLLMQEKHLQMQMRMTWGIDRGVVACRLDVPEQAKSSPIASPLELETIVAVPEYRHALNLVED